MAQPLFSLVYTSVRPDRIWSVVSDWVKKSRTRSLEIIITVDGNDPASQEAARSTMLQTASGPGIPCYMHVQPEPPFNCVKGWNLAAEKSTGKVLCQLTDDFVPPDGWDEKLLALESKDWTDGEFVVHVNDGYVKTLMTLAIMTRKRYDRFGYFFYPDYESLFCDTELTEVAYRDGVVIQAPHLLFEHMHPDCQKRIRDKVDLVHASQDRWQRGEALFNFRKSKGFPVDVGPRATAANVETASCGPALKFCAYIQATRDDFCLMEVCQRLREEGVNDFFFSVPDEYWSGKKTPESEMEQVKAISAKLIEQGASSHVLVHKVRTYRFPGDNRLRVETRVRNDALAAIRKQGFEHVLIVDGDELWRRGTLSYIKELIVKERPKAISTFMVPVVGLPGYPIDGASDMAVVYIDSTTTFKECRTPVGDQLRIHMPLVYHFTGVRRTMEEVIEKHRASGHYDDPDYDFETWIKEVLPNIKPGYVHQWKSGMKGIHMYQRYQIWPTVREWFATDSAEIPQSLWPYLGIRSISAATS